MSSYRSMLVASVLFFASTGCTARAPAADGGTDAEAVGGIIADYQQALNFAVRSYDIGPRVGEICSRNWRTISVAREHLDDTNGASDAEARANQCMNTRPKGL